MSDWNGWPPNPLAEGAHWVRERVTGKIKPVLWRVEDDAKYSPHNAARLFDYLGPCLTPSEVTALQAAAWRAGRDAAVAAIRAAGFGGTAMTDAIRALTPPGDLAAAQVMVPAEPTDAMLAALEDGCQPNRIQGFQYGDALVIRDVSRPSGKQEVWRGPADPRAEGERFSDGPLHDAFMRQCAMERQRIAYRTMIAVAQEGRSDAR